jgi:hypothetical protein
MAARCDIVFERWGTRWIAVRFKRSRVVGEVRFPKRGGKVTQKMRVEARRRLCE